MSPSLPTTTALQPAPMGSASGVGVHGNPSNHNGESASPGVFAMAWAGARRRWFFAGLMGLLLGSVAAVGYYTQTPQKFTVSTTLQISPLDPLINEGAGDPNRDKDYSRNQAALIRTRPVILKALETKGTTDSSLLRNRPDPAGWLETQLQSTTMDGGQLRLSLSGENPDELAVMLNAVTAAYLILIVDSEETQRRVRVDEFDKVLATSEDRVRKLREELAALDTTLHTNDHFKRQMILEQHAALLREKLRLESDIRGSRSVLEDLAARLEAAKTKPIPETLVNESLAIDLVVKTSADKLTELRNVLESSKGNVQPGSASHDKMLADIKTAEDTLAKAKTDRREPVITQLRDASVRMVNADIVKEESRIRTLEYQIAGVLPELEKARQEAGKFGLGAFDLELKRSQIAQTEAIMGELRTKKERLAIEMQTYKRRVNVTSPAESWAARPAASAVTATAGLGLAGFAFGFLGVGYLESRRRRLMHSTDVAQAMKLRVLGNLPLVPGLANGPLSGVWSNQFGVAGSLLIEAVTDLRTMLLAGGDGKAPQVMMVTSAGQGEGKTTLSCILALSLAQIGKRTLLIDGDLRKPQIAERLGLPPAAGLGEVLRGEARPTGVIGGVPGTPLAVMTAGRPCANVIRGLSADRVRQVFEELRQQFDYIVVDSCPTPMTDGLILGSCVDAAVLVVRSGLSQELVVREACERMLSVRVPLVGGVVNGVPISSRWLRYPYYTALPVAETSDSESLPMAQVE